MRQPQPKIARPSEQMSKTLDEYFRDWEAEVFGMGYGTGEEHTLGALKTFMAVVGTGMDNPNQYNYQELERTLTPTVAWLLINTLGRVNMIEYGTSPRFGWLTKGGESMKQYISAKSVDELVTICCDFDQDEYIPCYRNSCNCEPHDSKRERKCSNPFWED